MKCKCNEDLFSVLLVVLTDPTRFRTRSKVLGDQTELREVHFKTILRHKDAEIAFMSAKYDSERKRADTEAARCRTLTSQVSTFSKTEAELRSQLNIYVEKFKQVSF